MSQEKIILGIETSCDESAIALVAVRKDGSSTVIAEIIASQISLHTLYGGVVPELASREHLKSLPEMYAQLSKEYPNELAAIDAVAVTQGPGLKGCLLIGINFAKGLALARQVPLLGINHIEGHIYSGFLNKKIPNHPFFALVVSGGHSELIIIRGHGDYAIIARTIDDAAGEAFDKSAYILGFPYPGGKPLSECASRVEETSFSLPKVMRQAAGFSFSGLKTAIQLLVKKNPPATEELRSQLCYAIEHAITEALLSKVEKAFEEEAVAEMTIVGGVSANRVLRSKSLELCDKYRVALTLPEMRYATDNAAMIALAGGLRLFHQKCPTEGQSLTMEVLPRYPVEHIR